MSSVLPQLLGGLGLFIYAIYRLSEILNQVFSDNARNIIARYTSNVWIAILIGMAMSVMLDSSSAVVILVIIFINSKALTFRQAMGIILGANIGTTFASKIIALSIGQYSIIPLLLGLLVMLFSNKEKVKKIAMIVMYFGMLFFGLYTMEHSVNPLKESELFNQWIATIESNPYQGALIGGLITLIIQSSGGTVGMAIILAKQNLLSLAGGLAIMLGAELGTCSDTLLATIGGRRQALKAGLFHLTYSLLTIVIALLLFTPFLQLVQKISTTEDIGHQIANGHVFFNVLGVLLCLPFLGIFEKGLNRLLPDS